ncbi:MULTISPECIES: hypothetical protein [Streptomyces]|uniref:hypothetical protein n=1 Tax=Streptomyces TaxID=1883 RepID=UPI00093AA7BA|nr:MULTISPECIES: hypothetical protein [Streptomyces]MCX4488115.1 hypothetical protein [Streptomyces anulatus]MCX4521687.1 hypothetical protein [Streptomyces anulatus]MCX4604563.1 hypothetical protein [Streptomyces anulatus]WSU76767.1 hypothetical protein OG499_29180 [Streptomyces anulatus]WTD24809.1 hypothetical protein OH737_09850 [Streptomyces anulatus]
MKRRCVPALVLGGLWWWAVLRLVLHPEQAGLVEGAVAAGGWGLSLLPVHVASVVPVSPLGRSGRRGRSGRSGLLGPSGSLGSLAKWRSTRAWRRRRSAGESDRS